VLLWLLDADSVQQPRLTTFHACKTRGCLCSCELLMMGGVSPETCWDLYKHGIINIDTLFHLVGFFYMHYTAASSSHSISRKKYLDDELEENSKHVWLIFLISRKPTHVATCIWCACCRAHSSSRIGDKQCGKRREVAHLACFRKWTECFARQDTIFMLHIIDSKNGW
jgi:hypothetical protein